MSERVNSNNPVCCSARGLPIYLTFAIAFVFASGLIATLFIDSTNVSAMILAAACAGGFMALRVAANGVANHVGAVIGTGALPVTAAILVAIVCTAAGALLAGEGVIMTVSRELISVQDSEAGNSVVFIMMTALISASLWMCIARRRSARLSTTYAIVGGMTGAAMASVGINAVNWVVLLRIISGWLVTPILAGIVAGLCLMMIEKWIYSQPAGKVTNRRTEIDKLFILPLVLVMALFAFAHGANDVANSIGPLLAIYNALVPGTQSSLSSVPVWIMLIGVCGIATGTLLYGLKLVQVADVKSKSLERNRIFCVCLSASVIVIGASAMGFPVSSTHIAMGALLGTGFFHEIKDLRKTILVQRAQCRAPDFRRSVFGRKASAFVRPEKSINQHRPVYVALTSPATPCLVTLPATAIISAGLYLLIYQLSAI